MKLQMILGIDRKPATRDIAIIGLLIAIEFILSRYFAIWVFFPYAKLSFGFIPIVILAIMYGPVYAGIGAAVADFLGANILPVGPYIPGITITAFAIGFTYGVFLYRIHFPGKNPPGNDMLNQTGRVLKTDKKAGFIRVIIAAFAVTVLFHLGLNTIWLWLFAFNREGLSDLLKFRAIVYGALFPVQAVMISYMQPAINYVLAARRSM
ncbi:MAG: folate family ECF transporter S component [Oscillospiraceae bacterium]|nr:folate family ECF transporter S component [Oscillospiraceae bacterium]